jgi:hypothetical protein
MDLSENAGASGVEALDKLEAVLHLLDLAEALVGQALELLPDPATIEYVEVRIRDAGRLLLGELKASGRTPAQPHEAKSLSWPTETAYTAPVASRSFEGEAPGLSPTPERTPSMAPSMAPTQTTCSSCHCEG